ncbi:beta-N-acetylhexosaminidase [Celeribacter halophilus]|uniref:beta-N-acetylhexosaminidase n=1 Tax=Celeribacter halophilus TaxID=576117 RepID=UPI001C08BD9C|nr:beta-N-acetylhexosaminidase [Celeribacter halophilus]MBU2890557.1 beta-N-acetylhexosaminidase [Celeribacter halophilus]MDO6511636.1 beta-N-acetylhexosaminidase [Celeribacter halophilus]
MGQGAFIFGCEGITLSPREAAFFREAQPWGFILFARNVETPEQLRSLTDALRETVGRDAPVLIDQEGGRVQRMRAPHWREFLPPLDQVQQASDPDRALWIRGRLLAEDLHSVGIDVNCAPGLDVAREQTHPFLKNRCFSEDHGMVARMGRALVEGMAAGGVAPVMKHLPGHGRGTVDSHKGLPHVYATRAELAADFAPFEALSDLSMGMSAHIILDAIDPHRPATQSPKVIDLIREEIGFDGLLMTDDISMGALDGTVLERAQVALAAGCDMVLHCNGDLAEMEQLAHLGAMSETAQSRADHAAHTRPSYQPIDITALADEFSRT